ncbi:MAG TPA: winged helix-turn-helix transcriptional regulator [Sphingobium sp.]
MVLRRLGRSDIVARRVIPVSPVAVEYRITSLGETLITPFQALVQWANDTRRRWRRYSSGSTLPGRGGERADRPHAHSIIRLLPSPLFID